jgi:hypothetical protein
MFDFDPTKTGAVSAWDTPIEIDSTQVRLVRDLVELVGPRIGLDPIPCRGLWLQAVRKWQTAHGAPAASIRRLSPEDRATAALEIKDYFVEFTTEILRTSAHRRALKDAIDDAFEMYMKSYNRL